LLPCIFDLFSIGIGPSSSHTVGPMRAAYAFMQDIKQEGSLQDVHSLTVELYGSLAFTGEGHGTDRAILLGLEGDLPHSVDLEKADKILDIVKKRNSLKLMGEKEVSFSLIKDLIFHKGKHLPYHSNAMKFTALCGEVKIEKVYYSIGGGFIVSDDELAKDTAIVPYPCPFSSAKQLLEVCKKKGLKISSIMRMNTEAYFDGKEINRRLDEIWSVMDASIQRGVRTEGILPGGLNVKRRAPGIFKNLKAKSYQLQMDLLSSLDWINAYAMAVNEENAAGGRIVTAPTNGASGVIPAVMKFYIEWIPNASTVRLRDFLLTAGAIGALYQKNASLSAAEMGCQGEVGVACSMAAGALAELLGGTPEQVEDAAEIGMEHNLGLTCDPVQGLVQIPCIERNTMGALKAINAAKLALRGEGSHKITLDQVIQTMFQTGKDMRSIYKETSEGGLAVNFVEC
jgi:L-serine dehydratase